MVKELGAAETEERKTEKDRGREEEREEFADGLVTIIGRDSISCMGASVAMAALFSPIIVLSSL